MTDSPTTSPAENADQWQAYRYVTGELTDTEAASFESRLAEDVSLQTELADAVTLATGLLQVQITASPSKRSASLQMPLLKRWPIVTTAAVCLLACGLVMTLKPLATHDIPIVESAGDGAGLDAVSVVSMWSALGESDSLALTAASDAHGGTDDDTPLDVPNWMLLAVLDSDDDAADGLEGQGLENDGATISDREAL